MELDRTQIVIRQRGQLDLFDLALKVIRAHAGRLGLALVMGAAPFFALNHYLLGGLVEAEVDPDSVTGFWFLLAVLTVWEIPLATAPVTLYLGGVLFDEPPRAGQIARQMLRCAPQLLWYQVVLRGIFTLFLPTWIWLFSQWTYLNEVILLERNPMVRRSADGPSTGRRCRGLHAAMAGDLFGRWMLAVLLGGLLVLSLWGSLYVVRGMLLDNWQRDAAWFTLHFEIALWVVVGVLAVARFLGYLDLRIRREGWEMELLMRAEAARLRQTVASG